MTEQRKKEKISPPAHRLIHATNPDTIKKYLTFLSLNSSQMKKVNKLRQSLEIDPV